MFPFFIYLLKIEQREYINCTQAFNVTLPILKYKSLVILDRFKIGIFTKAIIPFFNVYPIYSVFTKILRIQENFLYFAFPSLFLIEWLKFSINYKSKKIYSRKTQSC